jgi:uncharacterized protein (TIGR00369 family)
MQEIVKYSGCFVCGTRNDYGLKAKFFFKDGKAVTECSARREYEGYQDVFHGGITSTLLDEVMIKALLAQGIYAMTVEMNVKFRKIVRTGQKLHFEGELVRQRGRLYFTAGQVCTEDGDIAASATGKYLQVNDRLKSELLRSLEF